MKKQKKKLQGSLDKFTFRTNLSTSVQIKGRDLFEFNSIGSGTGSLKIK